MTTVSLQLLTMIEKKAEPPEEKNQPLVDKGEKQITLVHGQGL